MNRLPGNIHFFTALLVIGTLVASFLHSELGVWDFDNHDHGHHDFCELVKGATTVQKHVKQEVLKDAIPSHFSPIDVRPPLSHLIRLALQVRPADAPGRDLYISNCALLI